MKVSLGKEAQKRGKFNKSRLAVTTSDIGFVQPLVAEFIMPNTKITNFSIANSVRVQPLVAPTFGQFDFKTYHNFIPFHDIYPPIEALLSQTPYSQGSSSYIPSSLPFIPSNVPAVILAGLSDCVVWAGLGTVDITPFSYSTKVQGLFPLTQSGADNYLITHCYIPDSQSSSATPNITPANADLVYRVETTSNVYYYCYRLRPEGRRLRKIFIGCGYQCNFDYNNGVSILPLLAYYKAYYDRFFPQVDKNTWMNTDAFKLIQAICVDDYVDVWTNLDVLFTDFIDELKNCYYTLNTDFFTAHQYGVSNLSFKDGNSFDFIDSQNSSDNIKVHSSYHQPNTSWLHDRIGLQVLNLVTKFINKDSVLGGRVREYLKVHYNADPYDSHNYFMGADTTPVVIDPVYSNAETSEGFLGEFAGKSYAEGKTQEYNFEADTFGYLISLGCVVPSVTNFAQVYNPTLFALGRWELPTPQFDALGYEVTPSLCMQGDRRISGSSTDVSSPGFGYIPRYSSFKVGFDFINGDISLPSTADTMSVYHMQRLLKTDEVKLTSPNHYSVGSVSQGNFTYSPEWRYIGKNPSHGNYNRFFYVQGTDEVPTDDYFIIDLWINLHLLQPLRSMADSFDTDSDENPTEINKE